MQFNRCLGCMEEIQGYPCPHCGFDPRKAPASNYVMPWGTVLNGHYVVGRVLGQGGFGITYIGYDLNLERKVAIKEYFPSGQVSRFSTMGTSLVWRDGEQAEALQVSGMDSFLREARKMAKMEDIPEVVRVRESFRENNTAYIVMDYIEGKTLLSVLKEKGPMPWEQARDIFLPAISAMEKVHQAGLVHRDLSPDNLMLTDKGVRILDLGAAKDLSSSNGASSAQVAKGGFSPFEQYTQRGGSGPWSDVYAMAATIYYTLTGVLPPNANDRMEEDTLDWTLLTRRGVPANVISALQKAMTVSAKGRTQSMAELLGQLQKGSAPRKRESKRTVVIAAAAAVMVVLGIALGFAVKAQKKPAAPAMALPPETKPVQVHVMVASENLSLLDYYERKNRPIWGQTIYKRGDVKTITFRGTLDGVPDSAWDVSEVKDKSILAWMEGGNLFVAADGIISPNPNASCLFAHFENVTAIDFGGCFDTSSVINMRAMFSDCSNLTELDVSDFGTSNVTDMRRMFSGCSRLTCLDLSGFDTSNVTDVNRMFGNCASLRRLNVSSYVTDMGSMFSGCSGLTEVHVSGFDTSRVINMYEMFYGCGRLTCLDLSGFDTSNVTNMRWMFQGCASLIELDVSGFNTSNVIDMSRMFQSCRRLTELDVTSFDTSNVTDMSWMFYGCDQLTDFRCADSRIREEYNSR